MRKLNCLSVLLAAALLSCGGGEHSHEGEEKGEEKHETHAGEVVIHEHQIKELGIKVDTVRTGAFSEVIAVSGEVMPAQGGQMMVVAKTSGIVEFSKNLQLGVAVSKGQSLGHISAKDMQGGDPTSQAAIAYNNAKEELERITPLYEARIVGAREYRDAKQAFELAKDAYLGESRGSVLGSPMSGVVNSLLVENGTYVQAGTAVASVSETERLTLKAYLPQRYFSLFPTIVSANFLLSYCPETFELSALDGRKLTASNAASTTDGYVPVMFDFKNDGRIVPGSYAQVYLLGAERSNVVSVPLSAVTEEQGYYFVYVKAHEEHFEKRRVELGQQNGAAVEIKSGLKPGESVVVEGAVLVKLAANTGAIPEGHHHH